MWRQDDVFYAALQGGAPGGDPVESAEELASNAREGYYAQTMMPTAPFIHGAAQFTAWIAFLAGGKLVIQPGKSFDARRCLELVGEEEVTTILMVGDAMGRPFLDLLEGEHDFNLDTLSIVASSGAILSPSIKAEFNEKAPNVMMVDAFGASETGANGSVDVTDKGPRFRMNEWTTVITDDGDVAPIGEVGMLARRGHVPVGYYKDEAKTAATFVEMHGVRWAIPGDKAVIEEDGAINVLGRGSQCINSGGEKIFPEEVEAVLKAHPDVFDAIVVGVTDKRFGETVGAVVSPRAGRRVTLEQLAEHCRTALAGYKVPRSLWYTDEVKRSPAGKPDYRWAKDVTEAGPADEVHAKHVGVQA
jgi:acyl-CoA synthetase (AMP-forming)/AMP-acid ligase II